MSSASGAVPREGQVDEVADLLARGARVDRQHAGIVEGADLAVDRVAQARRSRISWNSREDMPPPSAVA
jgi:hypothetical protein